MEVLWLLAVFLVPLAFVDRDLLLSELESAFVDLPKIALFRTLAALMAVFWLVEWSLTARRPTGTALGWRAGPITTIKDLGHALASWLFAHPSRWVIVAAALFLVSTLISTALSTSFNVSAWGLVPGQDSYPAYTVLAHVLLFSAVATHLKTPSQFARLLGAIISMGTLVSGYAVAQHFGVDPFKLLDPVDLSRATSTLGNPIVAGSVLVLTIPLALAAAVVTLDGLAIRQLFWLKASGWCLILAIQLLGLIFTFSRGPWVSAIAGLVALLSLFLLFAGWRNWIKGLLVLGAAVGISAVVVSTTQGSLVEGRVAPEEASVSGLSVDPSTLFTGATSNQDVAQRFASVGQDVSSGGLSGRLEIWRASQRLILQRPWFEFENLSIPWLRPIIGYGPDLFKYTYLLERRPQPDTGRLISERFAHNYFIHKAVELGALGLSTSLGLFFVPFGVGGYLLIRHRGSYSLVHSLMLAGLLATLAARFLEQLTGVASVSDLAISWVLLGAFAALPAVFGVSATETSPPIPPTPARRRQAAINSLPAFIRHWRPALAVVLILAIGILTWTKTIEYPLAAVKAQAGIQHIKSGQLPNALASLEKAVALAPDVFVYPELRAGVYNIYAARSEGNREAECGVAGDQRTYRNCLARKALSYNRQAAQQRPTDWRPQLALAESTLALASLEGTAQLAGDATGRFRRVAQMDPQAWWRWEALAGAYIQVDQPLTALEALETSFGLLGERDEAAYAFLLQGIARRDLEQPEAALDSFEQAIVRLQRLKDSPGKRPIAYHLAVTNAMADAYSNRGAVLNDVGRYEEGISDLDQAISLNPNLAIAYNNRANAYANLDQFQTALDDYREAIRLAPGMVLAYYNRALAHTYLGDDQKAGLDVARVTELGLDASALLARIEEAKKTREK